ncbi:aldehyde dehydrogenase [Sesbania bispinosa]|nr:aldehyde dehydrogenase [Sesbania bispinosa]
MGIPCLTFKLIRIVNAWLDKNITAASLQEEGNKLEFSVPWRDEKVPPGRVRGEGVRCSGRLAVVFTGLRFGQLRG